MTVNTSFIESLLCYLIYLNTDVKLWLFAFYILLLFGIVDSVLSITLKILEKLVTYLEKGDSNQ